MTFKSNADIALTAKRFLNRTLPKSEWTHEAHFAVALYLLSHPNIDPFTAMPDMIRAYNDATGVVNSDHEGYHETITFASLCAADHIAKTKAGHGDLIVALAELMESAFGRSNWLLEHWTKACLFSPKARKMWVPPDLSPLPFADPVLTGRTR